MRILGYNSFNKQQKLITARDLLPHTWMWKSDGLHLNTTTCGSSTASVLFLWLLSWRSSGFLNLEIISDSPGSHWALHPVDLMPSYEGWWNQVVFWQPDFSPARKFYTIMKPSLLIKIKFSDLQMPAAAKNTVNSRGHQVSVALKMDQPEQMIVF